MAQKSWPFKTMEIGDHVVLRESEYNLERARIYALVYAKQRGCTFRTAIVDDNGERVLVVKRVAVKDIKIGDKLHNLRTRYGFEHLEVGRSQSFHVVDPDITLAPPNAQSKGVSAAEFRRIMGGVYQRAKQLGMRVSVKMFADKEGSGQYNGMTITRLSLDGHRPMI